jgi:DNA-binding SARP family transcriptional activator
VTIYLRLLGSPEVTRDGEPVRFDTRKATALLARLAVRGQPEARDSLASLLWPEYDQSHASAALRRTLSVARAALGGSGLAIEGRTVALGPEVTSDVEMAGERLGSVRGHHAPDEDPCDACRDALRDLVALHRGTFLDGFSLRDSLEFDDWQAGIAAEMTEQHADALRRLVEAELARSDMEAALDAARRWAALDPLQEAAHVALMTVHARRGDRVAALRQYRECARVLEEELGVAPLPETTALSDRIRAAEAEVVGAMPVAPHPVAPQRTPPLPFVGRATEHQLLVDSWRDAASGRGRLILVEGEPGIGKTRLVAEAAATINADGGRVLALRCFEGEAMLAFAPLADALARLADDDRATFLGHAPEHAVHAAARLVPGLLPGPPRPEPELDEASASRRTVDGLAAAVAALATDGRQAGMVWVDDAQWADGGTAAVLGYLARRLDRHRLSLVIGRRPVGDRSDPLAAAVTTSDRDRRLIALPLERLGASEVQRLLREAGAATDDRLVSELMTESEGNPFYLSEYLAHASGRRVDEAPTLPPTVRALVLSRLAAIADLDLQILGAGAIIGRTFDVELVRRVSGRRPEEAVVSLERLRDHGLLVERPAAHGSAEWDFDHDKTRAVVLEEMTVSRRRLLHRRAAAGLEAWRSPGGRRPWGTIAAHLLEASEPRAAAHRFRRAGDEAAALHANAEALTHYRSALAHAPSEMAALRVRIGDLETLQGNYRAALAAYEAAAATASEDEVRDLDHRIARCTSDGDSGGLPSSDWTPPWMACPMMTTSDGRGCSPMPAWRRPASATPTRPSTAARSALDAAERSR